MFVHQLVWSLAKDRFRNVGGKGTEALRSCIGIQTRSAQNVASCANTDLSIIQTMLISPGRADRALSG